VFELGIVAYLLVYLKECPKDRVALLSIHDALPLAGISFVYFVHFVVRLATHGCLHTDQQLRG
jgi:hypothetical protein